MQDAVARRLLGTLTVALVLAGACRQTSSPASSPSPSPSSPTPRAAADAGARAAGLEVPPDAEKTGSGLASKVLVRGGGTERPEPQDVVEFHYTGWKSDGTLFDSSVARRTPERVALGSTIKGWREALQMMVTGEKRRLWVPRDLAYSDSVEGQPPPVPLIFDLELLKIIKRPPAPAAPDDLKTPPRDARKLKSGLAYRVLKKGTGTRHPKPDGAVECHFTGWGPDGRVLDSSIPLGEPTKFYLETIDQRWAEALRLMVTGEKARFWIPGQKPDGRAYAATYEFELIAIE